MRISTRPIVAAITLSCLAMPALAAGHFGARAGVNLSAFGGDFGDAVEPDNRVAPNVALVYEVPFSPNLAFHGEVGYAGKGGTAKGEGTDPFGNTSTYETEWRFDYVEVPLLLRGRFGSVGKATPFFELGPSFGIALSGKFEDDPHLIGEVDLKGDMKTVDVGWGAGAGVEFAAGPGRIGLEARYTRGFSDLFDINDNLPAINQAWTFAVSYVR
jgi:outer membrane protein with beta-barrel domain